MNHKEFLFLLCSSRYEGNTELLAHRAAQTLPGGVIQRWLRLIELPLPPFEDIRHDETRKYQVLSENEKVLLEATLSATDLVFASPLYWYSVSASAKLYLDYWSGWLRLPEAQFRSRMAGKKMWVICAVSDKESVAGAKPLIETLRLTAEYLEMQWGGVMLGYGNRPGDVLTDAESLSAADTFFEGTITSEDII